eukprot:1473435-Lingulodinium_polyedra.AAC.1
MGGQDLRAMPGERRTTEDCQGRPHQETQRIACTLATWIRMGRRTTSSGGSCCMVGHVCRTPTDRKAHIASQASQRAW